MDRRPRAWWLFGGLVIASALAIGTVHTVTLSVLTPLMGITCALVARTTGELQFRNRTVRVGALAAGLTLWTALQALPLPARVVRSIAPHAADVWSRCLRPLGELGPSFVTLSVDPISTRVQIIRGVLYLLTFVTAAQIARSAVGRQFLSRTIIVAGVCVALAALVHPAVRAHKIFGLYAPSTDYGRHISPILNANHLASYLTIAMTVALSEALSKARQGSRTLLTAASALMASVIAWTGSRGGVMTAVLSIVMVIFVSMLGRRRISERYAGWGAIVGIIAGAVAIFAGAASETLSELANADVSKLRLEWETAPTALLQPIVGIGRGAFETTFPQIRTGTGYVVFTHPENIIVQWLSEWGLPIGIGALVYIVAVFWPSRTLNSQTVGPWVAIAGVAIHDLTDFSAELPATFILLIVCAALVLSKAPDARPRKTIQARVVMVGAACAGAISGILGMALAGGDLRHDRSAITEAMESPDKSFEALVRQCILRHPGEPYFTYAAALRASRLHASVAPWVAATLERAPIYAPAHLMLARELRRHSASQGRLEYRLTMNQDARLIPLVTKESAGLIQDYYSALELAPDGIDGTSFLEGVAVRVSSRLPSTRVRIDEEITRRSATVPGPALRRAQDTLIDLLDGDGAPWCAADRALCAATALAINGDVLARDPSSCAVLTLRARIRMQVGEAPSALDEFEHAIETCDEPRQCWRSLVGLSVSVHDVPRSEAALTRLARSACTADDGCIEDTVFAADAERTLGRPTLALMYLRQALARDPTRRDLLRTFAETADGVGLHVEAQAAREKLKNASP